MVLVCFINFYQVCYSWWVLSSLCLIDRLTWISCEKLRDFILECQVIFTPSMQSEFVFNTNTG